MDAVHSEDLRASFLFVGYLNDDHQEWLGLTTTNHHSVAAFDFVTVSGCDQLVVGPDLCSHSVILDLPLTDVQTYYYSCCCGTHR